MYKVKMIIEGTYKISFENEKVIKLKFTGEGKKFIELVYFRKADDNKFYEKIKGFENVNCKALVENIYQVYKTPFTNSKGKKEFPLDSVMILKDIK